MADDDDETEAVSRRINLILQELADERDAWPDSWDVLGDFDQEVVEDDDASTVTEVEGDGLDEDMYSKEVLEQYEKDCHWISDQQLCELQIVCDGKNYPSVSNWKDIEKGEQYFPEITIDKARRKMKDVLDTEVTAVKRAYVKSQKNGLDQCALPAKRLKVKEIRPVIFDMIFGSESRIQRVFQDTLGWSEQQFLGFLNTFALQSAFKVSSSEGL